MSRHWLIDAGTVLQPAKARADGSIVSAVSIAAILLVGFVLSTTSLAREVKPVLIFEINGVRLYVPRSWIWPAKYPGRHVGSFYDLDRPLRPDDPSGTVYRSARGIALHPLTFDEPERFSRLHQRYFIDRIEIMPGARDLARRPRRTLDDIPESHRNVLRPADEHGFRRAGDGKLFYGAHPEDVTPSGERLSFWCSSPFRAPGQSGFCDVNRAAMDGLSTSYSWDGDQLAQGDWRGMNQEIQDVLDWLARPPEVRAEAGARMPAIAASATTIRHGIERCPIRGLEPGDRLGRGAFGEL